MDSDAGKRQRGKRSSGRLPEKQAGLSLVPELARLLENVDTRMTSEIMTGQRRVYARLCESMTAGELRSTQGLCNFFFFCAWLFSYFSCRRLSEGCRLFRRSTSRNIHYRMPCFPSSLVDSSTALLSVRESQAPHSRSPSALSKSSSKRPCLVSSTKCTKLTERGAFFCLCCADRHFLECFILVCALRPILSAPLPLIPLTLMPLKQASEFC